MIQMVDLHSQYLKLKDEIDGEIHKVIDSCAFINGPKVEEFAAHLSDYLGDVHVITCANGTDALQIALMSLGLKPGDEVVVPAFTYVASAEAIALLRLTPVMVDVDSTTFNISPEAARKAITTKTKAIIAVHLFGQSCNMEPLLRLAKECNLYLIEDNAQSLGAEYIFNDGHRAKTGTMGTIGCTSFFPSKNLGCYGDGGAIFTNDDQLANRIRMIANHGQQVKYHHTVIGCNSRLDTLQAAVLDVKLKHLDEYCAARRTAAHHYTQAIKELDPDERFYVAPAEVPYSTHVYHQYTLKINGRHREKLKAHLAADGIPSMVYYPLPLNEQEAFMHISQTKGELSKAKKCADSVLSLPIHTELTTDVQGEIIKSMASFIKSL